MSACRFSCTGSYFPCPTSSSCSLTLSSSSLIPPFAPSPAPLSSPSPAHPQLTPTSAPVLVGLCPRVDPPVGSPVPAVLIMYGNMNVLPPYTHCESVRVCVYVSHVLPHKRNPSYSGKCQLPPGTSFGWVCS